MEIVDIALAKRQWFNKYGIIKRKTLGLTDADFDDGILITGTAGSGILEAMIRLVLACRKLERKVVVLIPKHRSTTAKKEAILYQGLIENNRSDKVVSFQIQSANEISIPEDCRNADITFIEVSDVNSKEIFEHLHVVYPEHTFFCYLFNARDITQEFAKNCVFVTNADTEVKFSRNFMMRSEDMEKSDVIKNLQPGFFVENEQSPMVFIFPI